VIAVGLIVIFTSTINFIAETYYNKALNLATNSKFDEAYDNLVYAVNINSQRDYYHKEIASVGLSKLDNIIQTAKKDETTLTDEQKNQLVTTQQYLLTLINSEINKAILLNPNNYENWQRAALIYKKLTELSEGKQFGGDTLKAIEESINRNPTNPDNYLLLGYIYQFNSDDKLKAFAENAYLKAYDLQPTYALSIIQLGSYFEFVGKYPDALQLYTISKENVYSTDSAVNKFLNEKIEEMKKKIAEAPSTTPTPVK
jgi:tetratricopeptide (TPR) repeat protein